MNGDALRAALEARLGSQYEIEGLLGQGGMGSVFRALDRTLHRPVAIKVISADVATNPELKERFLLEARTVAKLRHPNIVAVYSAGDAEGLLYFVMELVPGESLRDLLSREGKVEPARAERILHELALALDYAHQSGIVHRDVKPENILLDRETGRAMLTDFGVARALEGSGNITGTGMILGSPRYMSPEQATGESTLDGRSDLYALALVGHEMFTGKPVVESGNVAGMLVKHLTETPKPIAEAAVEVPEGAAVAIDRALAKNREERWASGREMAEVIGMAWTPTPGSGVTRAIAAGGRKRQNLAFALGGAVVIAGVLVGMGLKALGNRAAGDPRKSYAVLPFEIQTGNAEVQWLRDGAVNMLTLALGQWSDLRVVDYERTLALVRDAGVESQRVGLEEAQGIARRGGAGTLVMGQVSTTTDSLLVVARLYDVRSGDALQTATRATALGADPRPLFDDLARYLLDVAGGAPSASVEIARATTTSIEAYRAYLDGVRLLQSWQLGPADSAFQVAIRADSTFALAWHKRALALGWGDAFGGTYQQSAQRAADLSDRLPARERALVLGHRELSLGLRSAGAGAANVSGREHYQESARIYRTLLDTDSLVAEAWYGLGDALFHDGGPGDSLSQVVRRLSGSVRAFQRTLAIDSTFHLAYSHLLQQYLQFSSPQSNLVLVGDSVRAVVDEATIRSLGGQAGIQAIRDRTRARGIELARGWVRADGRAIQPHVALAQGFANAGEPDSALAAIRRAQAVPELDRHVLRMHASLFLHLADRPAEAAREMQESLRTLRPADVSAWSVTDRITSVIVGTTVMSEVGNVTDATRVLDLFAADGMGSSPLPPASTLRYFLIGSRIANGVPLTGALRDTLLRGIAVGDTMQGGAGQQMRSGATPILYVAYLATRDTVFSNAVRRFATPGMRHNDLDALEALARGDTASARRIAAEYTAVADLANGGFSLGGMRAVARAEVLAAVGEREKAIGYFESLTPARMNFNFIEPGFAVYTRSYLARARLYEEAGDYAKAITAIEEFLARTEPGDSSIEPERRQARAQLNRLRDRGR
ncbi:MAG: protein kinase [Gemmatimonadaceae bacterium]|nr:protein kinase [Gemmatimonadaceae bacterium]